MWNNTSGYYNTAIGASALYSNTTATFNTASGHEALYSNTTGSANTATGSDSLYSNTTGGSNTASGYRALYLNTTGNNNTASGAQALYFSTIGRENTASGYRALYKNSTGNSNSASGFAALVFNTTGANNTASGSRALYSNATGNGNTAIGAGSLYSTASGYRNVALGFQAGYAVTGSDNIVIGAGNQGVPAENGVIRIGASAYQTKAFIAGTRGITTGATDAVPVLIDSNGQLGTIISSRRFKEDIQPMGSVSDRVFSLRPVTFRYRQPYADGSKPVQFGLVAEEVAEVFPELVVYDKDGKPETVAYHLLVTLLLNELQTERRFSQSLQQQVQMQGEQLAELRRDSAAQLARMTALEQQVAMFSRAVPPSDESRLLASSK